MANEVDTNADKRPEEIEREMLRTRESITEKVAALENQVVGTVQNAADTINTTVEAVKTLVTQGPEVVGDSVKQVAAAVKETFKDSFNVSGYVRQEPWLAVGGAALLGCITGWLISGGRRAASSYAYDAGERVSAPTSLAATGPREPGLFDELTGMVTSRVKELAQTAVAAATASLKDNIQASVPKLINEATTHLTDAATNGEARPGAVPFAGRERNASY